MKLSEFIVLPREEKRSAVLHQGVALAKWENRKEMVFLFQLPDFYVETYCCQESKEIREYRAFYKVEHLTLYLDGISIDSLRP